LDASLRSRGYSTTAYKSLNSAYSNKPTAYQQASYQPHVIALVKDNALMNTKDQLRAMLDAGMSRNPCNSFGESILHLICRLGQDDLLQLFIDAGADLQVADDYGRTLLHDCCWESSPNFHIVTMLLQADSRLLYLQDTRGELPLAYVPREYWAAYVEFFERNKDRFWPPLAVKEGPPPLTMEPPFSRSVPDPANALPIATLKAMASGRVTPKEVLLPTQDGCDGFDDECTTDDEDASSCSSSSGSDESDNCELDEFWNDLRLPLRLSPYPQ
jgi:Ankyrin repeats (3 copies)